MDQLDSSVLADLESVVADPLAYVAAWKERTGRKAIASFPMNFPAELIHAAGALPVILQDDRSPITEGRSLLAEFYCGYTQSVVDQAARGRFDIFDGIVLSDHCVQLLGAVDVIREIRPTIPMHFGQFVGSLDERWADRQVRGEIDGLVAEIEAVVGAPVSEQALSDSIRLYNENRRLLREFYDLRRSGRARIAPSQMQTLVSSSLVMDVEEHSAILAGLLGRMTSTQDAPTDLVRIHLSGHFCHGPRPELLDTIEECGALVVDDDLYVGYRYISSDAQETGDPFDALAVWYRERNTSAPCPTRVQQSVDWDEYLVRTVRNSESLGVIVLMAKFCEPHMLYYPELRRTLEDKGIPLLLVETEHDGIPLESLRTRVETFVERIRRRAAAAELV